MKTKIVIAEDHEIFRESLAELLNHHGYEVAARVSNGKELLDILKKVQTDIIVLDIAMPLMNGCEAVEKVLEKYPELKILVLSSFGEEKYYYQMVQAGVKGFVLKNAGMDELFDAISEVAAGGTWFSNELLQRAIKLFNKKNSLHNSIWLTERETEVLKHICNGLTAKDIAAELNLSMETIRTHRANLLSKTNCRNTPSLVMFAIKNQLINV